MSNEQLIDAPGTVRPGEELEETRLAAFLATQLGGTGPLVVAQFPRGYSNLTYLLRWGERELVLRRPPFGANIKGGHDMGREYRVLTALHPIYPKAPRPLAASDDPAVLGAPFYLMERVRGVILRAAPPQGLALDPNELARAGEALVQTLAELHALDLGAPGLSELGRPAGYAERQVKGWLGRYANARSEQVAGLEQAAAWLQDHIPTSSDAALVHNDYKYDNLVYDPADLGRVLAVLDWEMATLGDPLMDLGTTLGYWAEPGDPPALRQFGLTSLPGNLSRAALVERYAALSGREIHDELFYYLFGLFKVATIVQQIYARYRQGYTRDERFAGLFHVVQACATLAERALDTGRISAL